MRCPCEVSFDPELYELNMSSHQLDAFIKSNKCFVQRATKDRGDTFKGAQAVHGSVSGHMRLKQF